jgi:hypothetical protein
MSAEEVFSYDSGVIDTILHSLVDVEADELEDLIESGIPIYDALEEMGLV